MDRQTARSQLDAAVRDREATRTADETARARLERAIRDAHRAGLAHAEIAALTGMHRNSIGRITEGIPRD